MQLRHAILALLAIKPQSGYDLGQAFASSVAHFWHADQSQIYRTIKQLEADESVTTEVILQSGRPNRRVHSPADAGLAELDAWLTSPLEEEQSKEPFLARLFFASRLGPDVVGRLLDERESAVEETLDTLRAITPRADDWEEELRTATLYFGIRAAETELAWLHDTRDRLAAHLQGARQ